MRILSTIMRRIEDSIYEDYYKTILLFIGFIAGMIVFSFVWSVLFMLAGY
jgi:hypothetical protein